MHLLATFAPPEYAAWKAAFDARAAARDEAGLTLLQLWRHADAPDSATALFEVASRDRAEAWLRTEDALRGPVSGTFLRLA